MSVFRAGVTLKSFFVCMSVSDEQGTHIFSRSCDPCIVLHVCFCLSSGMVCGVVCVNILLTCVHARTYAYASDIQRRTRVYLIHHE